MAGMDRNTGRSIEGSTHIAQSLAVLFTTRIGTRLERRAVGSVGPELQDRPANAETVLDFYVAIAEAIDAYEPRVELKGFRLVKADEDGNAEIMVDIIERASGAAQAIGVPV